MIDLERMRELVNQATTMSTEDSDFEAQAISLGVEPDVLLYLYETIDTIRKTLKLPAGKVISYSFMIGVLVGREH